MGSHYILLLFDLFWGLGLLLLPLLPDIAARTDAARPKCITNSFGAKIRYFLPFQVTSNMILKEFWGFLKNRKNGRKYEMPQK